MDLRKKAVFVLETLECYNSVNECTKALGVNRKTVSLYLNGHYKSSLRIEGKYTVMYADDAYYKLKQLGFFDEEQE